MLTVFARRQRESVKAQLDQRITELMHSVAGHPILLYEVVAGGAFQFRVWFRRIFYGLPVDDHLADLVFRFFCQQVVKRHPHLPADQAAKLQLDTMEVKSGPTAEEVERSWVHEVFSSEEGRREHYRDGAGMAGQDHEVIIRN